MINIIAKRTKAGEICSPLNYELTVGQAMQLLLQYELGFGGFIRKFEPAFISVRTKVLGCIDDTEFSGSENDMKYLYSAVGYYYMLRNKFEDNDIDRFISATKGNPLLITAFGRTPEILAGRQYHKIAAITAITENIEIIKKCIKIKNDDLYALIDIAVNEKNIDKAIMKLI